MSHIVPAQTYAPEANSRGTFTGTEVVLRRLFGWCGKRPVSCLNSGIRAVSMSGQTRYIQYVILG